MGGVIRKTHTHPYPHVGQLSRVSVTLVTSTSHSMLGYFDLFYARKYFKTDVDGKVQCSLHLLK